MESIETHASKDVVKALIANKIDLNDERDVSEEMGRALAKDYGISYWEASAKSNINIKQCVESLIEDCI